MSDEQLDIQALRRESLEHFRATAKKYFADHAECGSMVLAVSQYFADEAGDAVHEAYFAFPAKDPWWPHRCNYEEPPEDGSKCSSCDYDGVPHGQLDSNEDAVFAWSAFCAEYGGGEGDPSLKDPIAVARRSDDGEVDLELVHQVVRPWMDNNHVGENREEESWSEEPPRPAPEPKRPEWTTEERRFIDAILASPADDGPRRVAVDYWLERGDVRGEYGALSFATPPTAQARRRRDALADEHGRKWLGPLQAFITAGGARFGRGPFVRSAVVSWNDDHELPEQLEEWAFLEEIRFAGEQHPVSKYMRGLERVYGVAMGTLAAMTQVGLSARINTVGLAEAITPQAWAGCPALAEVRHLVFEGDPANVPSLTKLPVWSQLESVEVWLPQPNEYAGAPVAWADDRGTKVLNALRPTLGAQTRLIVGYQFGNGAHGGVVAVATSAGVALEDRAFASDEARGHAARVAVQSPPPGSHGFFKGLLKRVTG